MGILVGIRAIYLHRCASLHREKVKLSEGGTVALREPGLAVTCIRSRNRSRRPTALANMPSLANTQLEIPTSGTGKAWQNKS
ncbi:hypothetical protein Taro_050199 [Colocasia esculenta]|uniref:Uncharacterized protein n=1 Tax=Colocasia esculenta TaxID=4460 RepID=A0A843XCT4_COLES|nr:hypothetical protein [Colocasia esculenta]